MSGVNYIWSEIKMKYEMKQSIELREGDFVIMTNCLDVDFPGVGIRKVPSETILKVTKTTTTEVGFEVIKTPDNDNSIPGLVFSINNDSPAEEVVFFITLQNLRYAMAPDLHEADVSFDEWPKKHLVAYIEKLQDDILDLNQ